MVVSREKLLVDGGRISENPIMTKAIDNITTKYTERHSDKIIG